MLPTSACGGASALYGAGLIIASAARADCRWSATVMRSAFLSVGRARHAASEVGVVEVRVAAVVEGSDSFDPVGVDGRAPVGVHHDRDRLFNRLPFAQVDGALDRLHRRR